MKKQKASTKNQSITSFFKLQTIVKSTNQNLPKPKEEQSKKKKQSKKNNNDMELDDSSSQKSRTPTRSRSQTPNRSKIQDKKETKKDPKGKNTKKNSQFEIKYSPKKKEPVKKEKTPVKAQVKKEIVKKNTKRKQSTESIVIEENSNTSRVSRRQQNQKDQQNKLFENENSRRSVRSQTSQSSEKNNNKNKKKRLKKACDRNIKQKTDSIAVNKKKKKETTEESEEESSYEDSQEDLDSEEEEQVQKQQKQNKKLRSNFQMEDTEKKQNEDIRVAMKKQPDQGKAEQKKQQIKLKEDKMKNLLANKKNKKRKFSSSEESSDEDDDEEEEEKDNKVEQERKKREAEKLKQQKEKERKLKAQMEVEEKKQEKKPTTTTTKKPINKKKDSEIMDVESDSDEVVFEKKKPLKPVAVQKKPERKMSIEENDKKPQTATQRFFKKSQPNQSSKENAKAIDEMEKGTGFKDLIFVFTGVLDQCDRDIATKIVQNNGGKVTGNVSGKTTYLVYGQKLEDGREYKEGSKYRKVVEEVNGKKKIKCVALSEEEFGLLLEERCDKKISDYVKGTDLKSLLGRITGKDDNNAKSAIPQKPQKNPNLSATPLVPKRLPLKKSSKGGNNENQQKDRQLNSPVQKKPKQAQQKKENSSLWTSAYAPDDILDCVGNQDKIRKMVEWLNDWEDVVIRKTLKKDKPAYKNWNTGYFPTASDPNKPACLISGPPGIGKTTSVRLIAKQLGYEIIETNASDIRNKAGVNDLLQDLINNTTLGGDKLNDVTSKSKRIILMDEVDGMSAGDRGGNQALMKWIDQTKTPIFCICNDRQSQKVRSLANHCYDLEFNKPTAKQVAERLKIVLSKENFNIDDVTLIELIDSLNCDIRQSLNCLQMWSKQKLKMTNRDLNSAKYLFKKDTEVSMTGFDAAKKLMNKNSFATFNSMYEKINTFMIDYSQVPLIVQNQYLESNKKQKYSIQDIENMADVANSIATGDIMEYRKQSKQQWALLPNIAIESAIYPCQNWCEQIAMVKFPALLGKQSSLKKSKRELKELRQLLGHTVTGSRFAIQFDYARPLLRLVVSLLEEGKDSIPEVIEILEQYNLTPDILKEQLLNAQFPSPKSNDYLKNVSTATKSALTRKWNEMKELKLRGQKMTKKKGGKTTANDSKIKSTDNLSEDEMDQEESQTLENEADDLININ